MVNIVLNSLKCDVEGTKGAEITALRLYLNKIDKYDFVEYLILL